MPISVDKSLKLVFNPDTSAPRSSNSANNPVASAVSLEGLPTAPIKAELDTPKSAKSANNPVAGSSPVAGVPTTDSKLATPASTAAPITLFSAVCRSVPPSNWFAISSATAVATSSVSTVSVMLVT